MKAFHIELAKTGLGLSGGENCMVEQIRHFKQEGIENVLFTTDNGRSVYEKMGLAEDSLLKYITIDSYKHEKRLHIFFSYLLRIFQSLKKLHDVNLEKEDVIFCHSEFFPNSIFTYLLRKRNLSVRVFLWFHMLAPDIFKGYEGHFTGKWQFPKLKIVHYKLNQFLYRKLAKKNDCIITVNSYYKNVLRKQYPLNNIYVVKWYSGIEIEKLDEEKKYDIAWMGRFHAQKGLEELPDILKRLKNKIGEFKTVIIGGGDSRLENSLKKAIAANGLEKNVEFKGFLMGQEKYRCLFQSKVFLQTSLFESFCQVNLEAMKCGLPVVAYDLPVFNTFKSGMIKCKILDNEEMASSIAKIIKDEKLYGKTKEEALSFSKLFSWKRTGEELTQLLNV